MEPPAEYTCYPQRSSGEKVMEDGSGVMLEVAGDEAVRDTAVSQLTERLGI